MRTLLGALMLFPAIAWAECAYLQHIVFENFYTRLVNRGPDMLTAYGSITNNNNDDYTLTGVSTPGAKSSMFRDYRQVGGTGDITAHTVASITIPGQGGHYTWYLGGPHIALMGFTEKIMNQKLQFGTAFDPNQSVDITFTFSDGCTHTLKKVPIRDRMQSS